MIHTDAHVSSEREAFAPRARAAPRLRETLRLGMPQLCLRGLSETWLLKDLGDRHWRLLAALAGRDRPEFRDVDGSTVYAAFRAVSIAEAALGIAVEHDALTIESEIERLSRTQFASRHHLTCAGQPIGTIDLCSTFVKRRTAGCNRAVARVVIDGFEGPDLDPRFAASAALAAAVRTGARDTHFGFVLDSGASAARFVVDPCPMQDFNGADFLYFVAFQSFVDRAEWHWTRSDPRLTTRHRDILYFGNVNPGDRVVIDLMGQRASEGELAHWCRVTRESDGARLAEVFTVRGRPRGNARTPDC